MNKILLPVLTALVLLTAMMAFAHETQTVGEGEQQYSISVGYTTEPAYTDERNGLALSVRTPDGEPVEHLESSLAAELTAPAGETLPLKLRAVHGQPGSYTADFVLTAPGAYQLSVTGFVGGTQVDLSFSMHDITPFGELRFP